MMTTSNSAAYVASHRPQSGSFGGTSNPRSWNIAAAAAEAASDGSQIATTRLPVWSRMSRT